MNILAQLKHETKKDPDEVLLILTSYAVLMVGLFFWQKALAVALFMIIVTATEILEKRLDKIIENTEVKK